MKRILTLVALLATITFTSCTNRSNSESNDNKSVSSEENLPDIQQGDANTESTEPEPAVYCHTCGSAINGSPYEAFGRVYCDMGCYADDPMN